MEPIGIRIKNRKVNHFTNRESGELMIVHRCVYCHAVSANRIAGDDSPLEIMNVFNNSSDHITSTCGIDMLSKEDKELVLIGLFGYDYQTYVEQFGIDST